MAEPFDGFAVAWDRMRRTGQDWSPTADRLRATREFVKGLVADEPWGHDDQYSKQFKPDFMARIEGVVDGCTHSANCIDALVDTVDDAAGRYREADRPRIVEA
ncbi:hypothetical protein AB0B45_40935 [Nonomuraea sp. NPDC049152]|uniref:hypothetical protein n=1 Tax=Nonomuraea sp. NPDC049152 TaxID=3154350 RepID=UPI0033CF50B9